MSVSKRGGMRVALDLTQVDNQTLGSGQFRYAADLIRGLCALDAPLELMLLGSTAVLRPELHPGAHVPASRWRYVHRAPSRGRGYFYRDVARLTCWLATHRVDVFHQIHTVLPLFRTCPVVVTAHHYYDDPVLFATRPYRYYCWALRHRADLIITVSDATRDDVARRFGVPRARMRTVYHGLSPSLSLPPSGEPRVRAGRFLLSPYNLSAPKNLRSLVAAWPAIAERYPDIDLVLYGRALVTPALEAAFDEMLRGTAHADRIRRIGHVSDRDLSTLYADCTLFVFPTTVEGFGYPLLEAMAHGACCITRNASAMREIGGDAVRLVETLRPDEISAAAIELLAEPSLRASLGERARQRASTFTVEAMSRKTLECYHAAAAGGRPRGAPSGAA